MPCCTGAFLVPPIECARFLVSPIGCAQWDNLAAALCPPLPTAHRPGLTLTRFEGTEVYNYSPLIYGYQLTNVALTGGGTLDGSGQAGFAQWRGKHAAKGRYYM